MKAMKTHLLAITLLFSYILGISCRICDQLYSYKEAEECCKDETSSIITINNSTELDKLTSKMANANLMSTWVPITRHGLDGFHWIEMKGRLFPALSNKPNTNKTCGLYNKKTNEIMPEHCSSSIGHICEIQNCTDCRTLGWDSVVCQQAETSCLIFSCDNKNWYDARLTCRQKGQRLAVAKTEPLKSALSRGEYACDYFWIGVRNTEWGPRKGEPQPGIPLWDVNEPSDVGNCSALFVVGDSYKLRSKPCNKKRHVICDRIQSHRGNQKGEKDTEKQTPNLALIITLPVVGAVIIIVIVAVLVFLKLKGREKPGKNGTADEKRHLKATEDSVESNTSNSQMPLSGKDKESAKLNEDNPVQKRVGGAEDMSQNEGEDNLPSETDNFKLQPSGQDRQKEIVHDDETMNPDSGTKDMIQNAAEDTIANKTCSSNEPPSGHDRQIDKVEEDDPVQNPVGGTEDLNHNKENNSSELPKAGTVKEMRDHYQSLLNTGQGKSTVESGAMETSNGENV